MSKGADRLRRVVSDHAIIRWLERIDGHDIGKVRKEAKAVTGRYLANDAALLRYMRHYHRFEVKASRRRIATDWVLAQISAGIQFIPVQNRKGWLRVHNGRITTVVLSCAGTLKPHQPDNQRHHPDGEHHEHFVRRP